MTLKRILAAAILMVVPASAIAMECQRDHAANACEAGFTWDEDTGACVEVVTG